MRVPRPLARAANRFSCGASSTMMRVTLRSSTSAPWLFCAFSTADQSTLCTRSAPFFGMNLSVLSALETSAPRTVSATRRHFCGEMRAYFSFAVASITTRPRLSGGLDFLVARVRLEGARRRELTQLVTHHVFGDEHRDVLLAVMHGDRETDHVRNDHRATRPGLDRLAVALGGGRFDFLQQVKIDERTFFQ